MPDRNHRVIELGEPPIGPDEIQQIRQHLAEPYGFWLTLRTRAGDIYYDLGVKSLDQQTLVCCDSVDHAYVLSLNQIVELTIHEG